jgi:hypothetical protein
MTPAGHHQPKKPDHIAGYRVGDRVITPLGRTAHITGLRTDGLLDAEYEGWHSRDGSVILQPSLLKRVI